MTTRTLASGLGLAALLALGPAGSGAAEGLQRVARAPAYAAHTPPTPERVEWSGAAAPAPAPAAMPAALPRPCPGGAFWGRPGQPRPCSTMAARREVARSPHTRAVTHHSVLPTAADASVAAHRALEDTVDPVLGPVLDGAAQVTGSVLGAAIGGAFYAVETVVEHTF